LHSARLEIFHLSILRRDGETASSARPLKVIDQRPGPRRGHRDRFRPHCHFFFFFCLWFFFKRHAPSSSDTLCGTAFRAACSEHSCRAQAGILAHMGNGGARTARRDGLLDWRRRRRRSATRAATCCEDLSRPVRIRSWDAGGDWRGNRETLAIGDGSPCRSIGTSMTMDRRPPRGKRASRHAAFVTPAGRPASERRKTGRPGDPPPVWALPLDLERANGPRPSCTSQR